MGLSTRPTSEKVDTLRFPLAQNALEQRPSRGQIDDVPVAIHGVNHVSIDLGGSFAGHRR